VLFLFSLMCRPDDPTMGFFYAVAQSQVPSFFFFFFFFSFLLLFSEALSSFNPDDHQDTSSPSDTPPTRFLLFFCYRTTHFSFIFPGCGSSCFSSPNPHAIPVLAFPSPLPPPFFTSTSPPIFFAFLLIFLFFIYSTSFLDPFAKRFYLLLLSFPFVLVPPPLSSCDSHAPSSVLCLFLYAVFFFRTIVISASLHLSHWCHLLSAISLPTKLLHMFNECFSSSSSPVFHRAFSLFLGGVHFLPTQLDDRSPPFLFFLGIF